MYVEHFYVTDGQSTKAFRNEHVYRRTTTWMPTALRAASYLVVVGLMCQMKKMCFTLCSSAGTIDVPVTRNELTGSIILKASSLQPIVTRPSNRRTIALKNMLPLAAASINCLRLNIRRYTGGKGALCRERYFWLATKPK